MVMFICSYFRWIAVSFILRITIVGSLEMYLTSTFDANRKVTKIKVR